MEMAHPALMKSSGWKWSSRFRDLEAVHAWGGGMMTPQTFNELPKDDKLDIIAWYEAKWRIDAINAWEQAEEIKRTSKPKRRQK